MCSKRQGANSSHSRSKTPGSCGMTSQTSPGTSARSSQKASQIQNRWYLESVHWQKGHRDPACIIPVLFGLSCEMSSIQQLPRKSCVLRGQASKPLSSSFRISINQTFKPWSMMNSLGNHPLPWPLSAQQHLMKTSVKETKRAPRNPLF